MLPKRKKTAFVPRFVFATACAASVVPVCATSCGGDVQSQEDRDAARDAPYGVADRAFDVAAPFDGPYGVADLGFDVAAPFDGPFGVADVGFRDSGDAADAPDAEG
jgi:hypothetical protein